jgi:hypothetical protein
MAAIVPYKSVFPGVDQAFTEGFQGYRVGFNLIGETMQI